MLTPQQLLGRDNGPRSAKASARIWREFIRPFKEQRAKGICPFALTSARKEGRIVATIANLQIDLSSRTARFSEGLQRAQQRVQQFSQRVQVDLQRVTRVGQRAALVFSGMTAALALTTKRAADYASTMDKVASQTGIAVEQIQELAFA